jgi:hypothetical protein
MKFGFLMFIFILMLSPCRSSDNVSPADAIFEPPKEMTVGIIKDVDATVYLTEENSTFNVTSIIEAHLSGPAFSFSSVSPIVQPITKEYNATWRWYVTPLMEGNQTLTLSIYNIYNNTEAQRWVPYERKIQVQVNPVEAGKQLFSNIQLIMVTFAWVLAMLVSIFREDINYKCKNFFNSGRKKI